MCTCSYIDQSFHKKQCCIELLSLTCICTELLTTLSTSDCVLTRRCIVTMAHNVSARYKLALNHRVVIGKESSFKSTCDLQTDRINGATIATISNVHQGLPALLS